MADRARLIKVIDGTKVLVKDNGIVHLAQDDHVLITAVEHLEKMAAVIRDYLSQRKKASRG